MQDIDDRVKAVVWYEVVKTKTGKSDDTLDEDYVLNVKGYRKTGSANRVRAFWAVKKLGADPDHEDRRGISLVRSITKESPEHAIAEQIFRSVFWMLLARPRPGLAEIQKIIEGLLERMQLFRATDEDAYLMQTSRSAKIQKILATGPTPLYKAYLAALAKRAQIDDLALLGALYQEAYHVVALEQALLLKQALHEAVQVFIRRWNLTLSGAALACLVDSRIIRNRWDKLDLRDAVSKVHGSMGNMIGIFDENHMLEERGVLPPTIPVKTIFQVYQVLMDPEREGGTPLRSVVQQSDLTRKVLKARAKFEAEREAWEKKPVKKARKR